MSNSGLRHIIRSQPSNSHDHAQATPKYPNTFTNSDYFKYLNLTKHATLSILHIPVHPSQAHPASRSPRIRPLLTDSSPPPLYLYNYLYTYLFLHYQSHVSKHSLLHSFSSILSPSPEVTNTSSSSNSLDWCPYTHLLMPSHRKIGGFR